MANNQKALSHYGILGMRWGQRRRSSALSANKDTKTSMSPEKKRKLLKTGTMFAASILASIGTKKIMSYTHLKDSKDAIMVAKAVGSTLGATAVSLAFDKIGNTKNG